MNHVNKGTMGIRIGGSSNININNCYIHNLLNIGSDSSIENTENNLDNPIISYAGADTRGIIISNCRNIKLNNNTIKILESNNGCCEAVCINEKNKYVKINELTKCLI